jgi:hypothetical protein
MLAVGLFFFVVERATKPTMVDSETQCKSLSMGIRVFDSKRNNIESPGRAGNW